MQIDFILKKNSDLRLKKMQICLIVKKNSDLHLRKMQIYFILKKKIRSTSKEDADLFYFEEKTVNYYMQIFKTKKQIITTIKESRTYINKLN